jgi:hypothetical protein
VKTVIARSVPQSAAISSTSAMLNCMHARNTSCR